MIVDLNCLCQRVHSGLDAPREPYQLSFACPCGIKHTLSFDGRFLKMTAAVP